MPSMRALAASSSAWTSPLTSAFDTPDWIASVTASVLQPPARGAVVGVGRFAEKRAQQVVGAGVEVGCILHPSPASPATNRDWAATVDGQLRDLGFEP